MIYIGIDPGLSGALGVIEPDRDSIFVWDMPTTLYGKTGKRRVDYAALRVKLDLFREPGARVMLEQVSAMPGQGVTSMFSFGMSYGGAWAVCAALGLPVTLVRPQAWKAYYGIDKSKGAARKLASSFYPGVDLSMIKHDGRAEALLIARYGMEKSRQGDE